MEEEKTRINKQMAELELQALRSQMNPHFMFNSLNSIKNYILKNETTKAAEYLSNFSHLIRMILQNSREKTVSLQEELDTLLLYIDLEKMRFRDGFEFTCQIDDRVPIAQVQIPPMIVQPFIENAIWHGLLHKEGDRHLVLRIREDHDAVLCEIEDDGIGRQAASEIKSKSATQYKSMGMGITQDRITLLNSMNALGIQIEVIDKTDEAGHAGGTLVKINIPYARHSH
jgi:LytS/YehU family sensor histidine kinase